MRRVLGTVAAGQSSDTSRYGRGRRAREGGMRLTFSAVGGFGAVFGGEGEGGFNEAGVGQVPVPAVIHPPIPGPPATPRSNVSAAQKRTSQLRVSNKSQMKREMGATGDQ